MLGSTGIDVPGAAKAGRRLDHHSATIVDAMKQRSGADLAEIGIDRLALALVVAIIIDDQNSSGCQFRVKML